MAAFSRFLPVLAAFGRFWPFLAAFVRFSKFIFFHFYFLFLCFFLFFCELKNKGVLGGIFSVRKSKNKCKAVILIDQSKSLKICCETFFYSPERKKQLGFRGDFSIRIIEKLR